MKKSSPLIDRAKALGACPENMPFLKKEMMNGKLFITVEFVRPKWQQVLGGEKMCQRTFGLDLYGQRVYELCDKKHSIQEIIEEFAEKHKISVPEAEIAVTEFIHTLMAKGLIGIDLDNMEND